MNTEVIILGGGGHASVLLDMLTLQKIKIIGICDPQHEKNGLKEWLNLPIISEPQLAQFNQQEIFLVNAIGSTQSLTLRDNIFQRYRKQGYRFFSVIHPSAIIAQSAYLGEGVQIMAGVVVQPEVRIEDNTIINTKSSIDHHSQIGYSVHIAPGSVICGQVNIGARTHIGAGTIVIQNITIGEGVLVGAGCTIRKNIENGNRVVTT